MATKTDDKTPNFYDDEPSATNAASNKQKTATKDSTKTENKQVALESSGQQTQQNQQHQSEDEDDQRNDVDSYREDDRNEQKEVYGDWYYDGMEMKECGGTEREKTFTGKVLKKTLKESKRNEPSIENVENVEVNNDGVAIVKISWKPPPKLKRDMVKDYTIKIDLVKEEEDNEDYGEEGEGDILAVDQTFDNTTTAEFELQPSSAYRVMVIVFDTEENEYSSDFVEFETQSVLGTPEIDEISELRSCDPNVKKVMITWVPPSGVEEDEVREYHLFIKSTTDNMDTELVTCTPAENSRIFFLKPDTDYLVAVKAMTDKGVADSEEEEFKTGEALGKPTITKVEHVHEDRENNTQIMKVSWSPPDIDEEAILKYEISAKVQNPGKKAEGPSCATRSFGKDVTDAEFHLVPDIKYTFIVTIFAIYSEAVSDPITIRADPGLGKPKIENIFEIIPSNDKAMKKQVIIFWEPPTGVEKKDVKEYKVKFQAKKKDAKTWLRTINASKTHAILWLDAKTTYKFTVLSKSTVINGDSDEKLFTTTPEDHAPVTQNKTSKSTAPKTTSSKSATSKQPKSARGTSTKSTSKGASTDQYSTKSKADAGTDKRVEIVDYDRKMIGVIYVNKNIYAEINQSQKK